MTKWQEVKLDELISIKHGYAFKGEWISTEDNGVVLVTPGNFAIGGGFQEYKCKFFTDEYPREYVLNAGDLIVTMTDLSKECDTLGYSALVPCNDRIYLHNQRIGLVEIKSELIDKKYLYWFMRTKKYQHFIVSSCSGSVIKHTSPNRICAVSLPLPPLDTQKKIAGVLSALDDKIELNNKINQNLELQAQALFNKMILSYSKKGYIGDYCSVKSGFAFKSSWWQETGVKVIKIKNIEASGLNLQDCSFVSKENAELARDFVVKGGDLLIATTGATIGKFTIVPKVQDILVVNQRVGKFFLGGNPVEKLPFIYCTLKQQEILSEIINRGQGSAQANISGNDIMSISCVYPDETVITNFNSICQPYFEKIITNQYENTRLVQLRDTLLPKLMSGELDVSQVDISKEMADN